MALKFKIRYGDAYVEISNHARQDSLPNPSFNGWRPREYSTLTTRAKLTFAVDPQKLAGWVVCPVQDFLSIK